MGDYRKIRKRIAVSFMAVMMMGILSACSLQKGNESDASLDANGQAGGVIFSKTSGVYGEAFDLQLDGVTEGTVYYTLDGSDPRTSDSRIKYEGKISITDRKGDPNVVSAVDPGLYDTAYAAINPEKDGFMSRVQAPSDEEVDKCTVVKAAVVGKDGSASEVTTHTYFVGSMADHIQGLEESCAAAGMDLAVISISMEYDDLFDSTTGIYVKGDIYDQAIAAHLAEGGRLRSSEARDYDANYKQRGREWERTAHIDFFECNTDDSTCVLTRIAVSACRVIIPAPICKKASVYTQEQSMATIILIMLCLVTIISHLQEKCWTSLIHWCSVMVVTVHLLPNTMICSGRNW